MCTATARLKVVRCPYCVLDDDFRPMVAHLDGRYICAKCGHLANPRDKDFRCSCPECVQVIRFQGRPLASLPSRKVIRRFIMFAR